jgi:hypothetical protein
VRQQEDTTTSKLHEVLHETPRAQLPEEDLNLNTTPRNTMATGRKEHMSIIRVKNRRAIKAMIGRAFGEHMEGTRLATISSMSKTMDINSNTIKATTIHHSNGEDHHHNHEARCSVETTTARLAQGDIAMAWVDRWVLDPAEDAVHRKTTLLKTVAHLEEECRSMTIGGRWEARKEVPRLHVKGVSVFNFD